MNRVFITLVCAAVGTALLRDALPADTAATWFTALDGTAMKAVTQKALDSASDAARLSIGLVGMLALWMGVMRVAERAGLVRLVAAVLRPLLVRLFPGIPATHPAMGAIVMNMSANLLGLGNAATPLGLEAMKRMQELNPDKKTATNAMALFLALNTTHITLIPATTIALRLENHSKDATNIVVPTILATACGMLVALVVAKLLERRAPEAPPLTEISGDADRAAVTPSAPDATDGRVRIFALGAVALAVALLVGWAVRAADPSVRGLAAVISDAAIPFFMVLVVVAGALKRLNVYEAFVDGAKEGFETAVRVIPYLVAVLVVVGMVNAAGLLTLLAHAAGPALALIGVPAETLPMMLIRPLSGSGANGVMVELMKQYGADSQPATTAAVMSGAADTTFYILAVYFGSVGIQRVRHALVAGLLGDLAGLLAAAWITKLLLF